VNNALALIPTQDEFGAMLQMADVLVKSQFLPQSVKTKEQAVTIMMVGRELNIPPWQAINGVSVIQGRPTVAPQLMLSLIRRSGLQEDIQIVPSKDCYTVTMKRKGETAHTETFTMDDATRMGLAIKDNWKKQPMTMLKWRAVAACARVVYPDVIMGLYTPEELAPDSVRISEDGEMEYVQVAIVERPALPTTEDKKPQRPSDAAMRIIKGPAKDEQPVVVVDGSLALDTAPEPEADTEDGEDVEVLSWDTGTWPVNFISAVRGAVGSKIMQLDQMAAVVGIEANAGLKPVWVSKFGENMNDAIQAVVAGCKILAESQS
jgi:hypothetical protein